MGNIVKRKEKKSIKPCGFIYEIRNKVNDKVYIGQTIQTPKKRERSHFSTLRRGIHKNPHLQSAFNKYGESNFKFTVLNYATDKKTLDDLENEYIARYNCLNNNYGYNMKEGGGNGKPSKDVCQKISDSHKGTKNPMYGKRGPLNHMYGRCGNENPNYGKKRSLTTRKKMSKCRRNKGKFGFTGTHLIKKCNPENKPWQSTIHCKGHTTYFGMFHDPLSCQIVHDLVLEEIQGVVI